MPPVIEVLISPTGETTIETKGFSGPTCREATQALEAALGIRQSETLTAEYHQIIVQLSSHKVLLGAPVHVRSPCR